MVDKLAVIQAEETKAELEEIEKATRSLIVQYKILISTSDKISSGLLSGKIKDFTNAQKLSAESAKESLKISQDIENQNKSLTKAKEKLVFVMSEEGKELSDINAKIRQQNKANKEQSESVLKLTSAYDELNKKHAAARKSAMDAGVQHGILSREFQKAASEANAYDQQLKRIDAALGKFNRNVGNYGGNILGLNAQMGQILREMPNFAMSAQIGIMSLTNNLPYFADAIADVNTRAKELKKEFLEQAAATKAMVYEQQIAAGVSKELAMATAAQAEAQVMANYQAVKAPSIWKQLASSLFSWQSLLMVGITLMTLYGKDIIEWSKKMLQGADSVSVLTKYTKALNEAKKEANSHAGKEITNARLLYNEMKNEKISREQRLKAAKDLQELYPKIFGNMTLEQMLLNDTTDKYHKLTKAIRANAMAEAIKNKISEKSTEYLDKEAELTEKIKEELLLQNKMKQRIKDGKESEGLYASDNDVITASKDRVKKLLEQVTEYRKGYNKEVDLLENKFTKESKIGDFATKDTKTTNLKTNTVKSPKVATEKDNTAEIAKELRDQYNIEKDNIENTYKLRLEAVKNNIDLVKDDPYATETEKLTSQMNYYSELIKINSEYYTALIDNAKKYKQDKLITDLETQRDTNDGAYQKSRESLGQKMPDALKKDLEYQQQISAFAEKASFEERKRLILTNNRLSLKEKEYQLSVLEQEQNIKNLEIEKEQIELRQKALQAKAGTDGLTQDEKKEWAEITALVGQYENSITNAQKDLEKTKFDKVAQGLQPLVDFISGGLQDLGLNHIAGQFTAMYNKVLKEGKDFR